MSIHPYTVVVRVSISIECVCKREGRERGEREGERERGGEERDLIKEVREMEREREREQGSIDNSVWEIVKLS